MRSKKAIAHILYDGNGKYYLKLRLNSIMS